MTYDEWKKARVEAASDELAKCYWEKHYPGEDADGARAIFVFDAESALKAAAAVPLPGEEALRTVISELAWKYVGHQRNAFIGEILAVLRPWIATQIERGK